MCKLSSLSKAENSQGSSSPKDHSKEKRKQRSGSSERGPKRLRLALTTECTAGVDNCHASAQDDQENTAPKVLQPRSNRLSHTRRLKQRNASELMNNLETSSKLRNYSESHNQPEEHRQRGKTPMKRPVMITILFHKLFQILWQTMFFFQWHFKTISCFWYKDCMALELQRTSCQRAWKVENWKQITWCICRTLRKVQ